VIRSDSRFPAFCVLGHPLLGRNLCVTHSSPDCWMNCRRPPN